MSQKTDYISYVRNSMLCSHYWQIFGCWDQILWRWVIVLDVVWYDLSVVQCIRVNAILNIRVKCPWLGSVSFLTGCS